MVKQIKYSIFLLLLMVSTTVGAQFSVGGGASTLLEFGNRKPFYGLHFNVEVPRNNEVTFYGRLTYHFRQNNVANIGEFAAIAKDVNTQPSYEMVNVDNVTSLNYFMIDGGTRYYLLNGFDEGFSLYGGTNLGLIVNTVKYGSRVGDYNADLYTLEMGDFSTDRDKGTIIRLAVGFTGGIKYTIPTIGSFYFDVNPHLTIFGIPSSANIPSNIYRPVFFNFNIGFRKELY